MSLVPTVCDPNPSLLPDENHVPAFELREVSFAYPSDGDGGAHVLKGASMKVPEGAFVLLVGGTGSGKTTCLRLAKREVAPAGNLKGSVLVFGHEVRTLGELASSQLVGYVFQSPDNQIVCDTVWHELAFGLENLGLDQQETHRRLAEVCLFLGIEGLFRKRCDELSGGQRQVVALAAVLAMRPRLLLLDEPTSMLDPVAEKEFLSLLFRANRELGLTVVVATHEPQPMVDYATCAFGLEEGVLAEVSLSALRTRPALDLSMARVVPMTQHVRERLLDDVWVRYERSGPWVLRGCDLLLGTGEVRAIVGGNGSGKSTVISTIAGVVKASRGKVGRRYRGRQALLPQQPKALLGCETVREELMEWSAAGGYGESEVVAALERLGLTGCSERHPYDLSGGQQQLLALEKLLLMAPELLLLDEPTKGLDGASRTLVAERVNELASQGRTVLVATHDMAFVKAVAHGVSLLFDGRLGETEETETFFEHSWMWRA